MFKDRSLRLLCAGLIALVCGALTALFVSSHLGDVAPLQRALVTVCWTVVLGGCSGVMAYVTLAFLPRIRA